MSARALDAAVRAAGPRVVAALAARFRDLDVAEDAFAEACARAIDAWRRTGVPRAPAAWLYRVAERFALDALRRDRVRDRVPIEAPCPPSTPEESVLDDSALIPDERLRLIFVCCHPAVAPQARAALTLRLVCGLSMAEIARAFFMPEPTLAQRLVRAKRKIAEAGVPFEVPGPDAWSERVDAVLSTLEIAYAKAHEDAAGAGPHAGYATEMLGLTHSLADLLPDEPEALALAALVRYAEARRPARLDAIGAMMPLARQDPSLWQRPLVIAANAFLERALRLGATRPRVLQAAIHGLWSNRPSLAVPPPWADILAVYDVWMTHGDNPVVRLNRAVALAEVAGVSAAIAEIEALGAARFAGYLPYHATRADLLRRAGDAGAADAYDAALALDPPPAERLWLEAQRQMLKQA